jgi:lysophospholipase L1-like esterase
MFLGVVGAACALGLSVPGALAATPSCANHWVGSWSAAPSDGSLTQQLANQTLRMIVAPHLAGTTVRVRLSNRFGAEAVTLGPATVGQVSAGAALTGAPVPVLFKGRPQVTIPAGADAVSDAVAFTVAPPASLAVSLAVPGVVTQPTEHVITRQTSYLTAPGTGDHSAEPGGELFAQPSTSVFSTGWYFLSGIDVLAPAATGAVVTFGDSITDGFQSDFTPATEHLTNLGVNERYPDFLARRLNAAGVPLSVLNSGISGNRVLADGQIPEFGPRGLARFRADALALPGVTDVILLEGINDIGQGPGFTSAEIIAGYKTLIAEAHAAGVKIRLGTLMPAGGSTFSGYSDEDAVKARAEINAWIRGQNPADGFVDFDAAVRDPADPSRLKPEYDGSDHLHLSAAGYAAMAAAVDLAQLQRPAECRARARARGARRTRGKRRSR